MTNGSNGVYVQITFGGTWATMNAPPPPTCGNCGSASVAIRTPDGVLWCKPCFDVENRRRVIEHAEDWMSAVFLAVSPDNRGRAYKQLAALFHPDQGGDEKLMIALNNVRDRFR